jgi:pyrroline-5-carboxylate reductase
MRIGFIGGGTMAEAILSGVLDRELASADDIAVAEVIEARRGYLSDRYGVRVTGDGKEASGHGSLVVLAVKPQDLPKAMSGLRKSLTDEQAAVSIVAGATIKSIQKGLDHDGIVRIMPNTPAQIGAGVSVWTATEKTPPARLDETRELLQAIGVEVYVPSEKYVDMATGLSGSGPAYVFLFIEALTDAGVQVGLSRDIAATLATQTVLGSAQLLQQTGRHPAELRNAVTSPGGTTAEGLMSLESNRFRAAVMEAVESAYEKAVQLGEED